MDIDNCEICGVEAFIRCKKHNKCDDCGLSKEESKKKKISLVHRLKGLICDPCWKIRMNKKIEDFSGDIDCTDEITCPYCGWTDNDSWETNEDMAEVDCGACDNKFSLSVNHSVDYTTSKIAERTGVKDGN